MNVNIQANDIRTADDSQLKPQEPALCDTLDIIGDIEAIQVELKKKIKQIEDLKNSDRNTYWEKMEELKEWYKNAMAPFETKKQENLKMFEGICYHSGFVDLEMQVSQGGMDDREINIYKDWDREKVKKLQKLGIIDYDVTYLSDILKHYDGIRSCDLEKVEKISQLKGFFLLSVLDDLNEVDISEKRLKELQELTSWKNKIKQHAPFIIDNARIFDDDKYEMPIDLIKDAIQKGAVVLQHYDWKHLPREIRILSYSKEELEKMIQCYDELGTVFYGDDTRECLGKNIPLDDLKEIKKMFSCSLESIDEIAGQEFKMERLKSFKEFLQEHEFESSMPIQEIIDLNNLEEEEYKKVCENLLLLQKVGISFDGRNIKFLSTFSREWIWKPTYRVEDVSGHLMSLKIYPLLEICNEKGLLGGKTIRDIVNGSSSLLLNALVNENYDPNETDPEKLKQSLKIDREGLKELQDMEIYPNLEFFCKRKNHSDWDELIGPIDDTKINVQNFKRINKIYPLKNLTNKDDNNIKIMQNIQKDRLNVQNIIEILCCKFDNSDYKITVKNIIPCLPPLLGDETYTIYNIQEKEWDITQALKIMEQFVQANPQLKIREE